MSKEIIIGHMIVGLSMLLSGIYMNYKHKPNWLYDIIKYAGIFLIIKGFIT